MAQEATERYLLLRQVYQQAFHNLDISEPTMEELLSLGWVYLKIFPLTLELVGDLFF